MAKNAALDLSGWNAGLDKLDGPMKESLARRMLVEGGVVLRDEAKRRCTVKDGEYNYNPASAGSQASGTLRDSIYLVRNSKLTQGDVIAYSVSWNNDIAFWGKYVEFGFMLRYQFWIDGNRVWHTNKDVLLHQPIKIPAQPFLGPTMDALKGSLANIMITRGRQELPKLLKGEA